MRYHFGPICPCRSPSINLSSDPFRAVYSLLYISMCTLEICVSSPFTTQGSIAMQDSSGTLSVASDVLPQQQSGDFLATSISCRSTVSDTEYEKVSIGRECPADSETIRTPRSFFVCQLLTFRYTLQDFMFFFLCMCVCAYVCVCVSVFVYVEPLSMHVCQL